MYIWKSNTAKNDSNDGHKNATCNIQKNKNSNNDKTKTMKHILKL